MYQNTPYGFLFYNSHHIAFRNRRSYSLQVVSCNTKHQETATKQQEPVEMAMVGRLRTLYKTTSCYMYMTNSQVSFYDTDIIGLVSDSPRVTPSKDLVLSQEIKRNTMATFPVPVVTPTVQEYLYKSRLASKFSFIKFLNASISISLKLQNTAMKN